MKPFERSKKLLDDIEANNATKEKQIADINTRIADKEHLAKAQETEYKDLISKGMIDKAIELETAIETIKREIQGLVNAKNVLLAVDNNNHLNKLLKSTKETDLKAIQKYADEQRLKLYKLKLKYLQEIQKFVKFNDDLQGDARVLNININLLAPEFNLKESYQLTDHNFTISKDAIRQLNEQVELYEFIVGGGN